MSAGCAANKSDVASCRVLGGRKRVISPEICWGNLTGSVRLGHATNPWVRQRQRTKGLLLSGMCASVWAPWHQRPKATFPASVQSRVLTSRIVIWLPFLHDSATLACIFMGSSQLFSGAGATVSATILPSSTSAMGEKFPSCSTSPSRHKFDVMFRTELPRRNRETR
ncbi:hypothetical protein C8034_v009472 [Colletotrichum sidae]|uniref:Uncharacterized protein n=1 Tax=Colletotrichum sidae TaxID=1347389 RepID=A0A4R8TLB2_9PEZI|nr:hypothetical protein C8034_v009472 [Colletotrichum sidae]